MRTRRSNPIDRSDGLTGVLFPPSSDWRPPHAFPDLRGEKVIGIDVESRDPNLNARGPGFIRGDAEISGIAVATKDRGWYFPIRHLGGGNMDVGQVQKYFRDFLSTYQGWVVGAHLAYDLEALWSMGIEIHKGARLCDVQIAEALLDEERDEGYDLETLCSHYLEGGKDEALLREAASAYGIDPKGGLWKLPSRYVGPYAERDAWAPIQIFSKQLERMAKDDLLQIFELESRLLPLLHLMRLQGIPVDLERARGLSDKLLLQEGDVRVRIKREFSLEIDEWSGQQLASTCERLKIPFPRTPRGNPSFEGEWLEAHDHPFLRAVSELRTLNRLRSTFVNDWIFKHEHKGIIHPVWKQLKRDDGGTRTGRMAASCPNPQQVPSRSEFAPLVRELFVPGPGRKWGKLDYSQQEPRILVHYASLCECAGAEVIRLAYQQDKSMDIYQFLSEVAKVSRRNAKDLTLGRCYGMGAGKLALKLGIGRDAAQQMLDSFDSHVPFVREVSDMAMRKAQSSYWEPMDAFQRRRDGHRCEPVTESMAKSAWPGAKVQRAYTHKALNSLIQGSAADMTKSAMLKIYDEMGLVPYMQVHDELNYGVEDEAQARKTQELAETCVEMRVPIRADLTIGTHWK